MTASICCKPPTAPWPRQANMLQRMRELAVQSASGTYSDTQRGYLNTEFAALSITD